MVVRPGHVPINVYVKLHSVEINMINMVPVIVVIKLLKKIKIIIPHTMTLPDSPDCHCNN